MASRRSPFAILTLLFILSLPAVTPRIFASDEIHYFAFLRSLWFDQDVSFDNEYRYFHDRGIARAHGFEEAFLEKTTSTGLRINFGTVGAAILWSPFYALADAGVVIARTQGSTIPRNGYSWPYVAAVCYGSATYGFLSILVSLVLAREVLGRVPSRLAQSTAALAIWWGTPLAFYMYLSPVMAHATSAFMVSVVLLAWVRVRTDWSMAGSALLGGLIALMVMVREQDLFFVPVIAVDYLSAFWDRWRQYQGRAVVSPAAHVLSGVTCAAAGLLLFMPQALAYLTLNGRLGPSPLVSRKLLWDAPHAASVLFSPGHGLFVWTPVALVALGAGALSLVRVTGPEGRHLRVVGWQMLLMCLCLVYIAGSLASWTAAGAFGQRRFISLSPILLVLVVSAVEHVRPRLVRSALVGLLALASAWNLSLAFQFSAGLMDRQRLDVRLAAYNTVFVIPKQVPRLVSRFLFDRSSFYRRSS